MVDNILAGIKVDRTYERIVEQVKNAIVSGKLRPGDRLPPERELAETLGVSRISVREALRMLEALGVLDIRPGKGGGIHIRSVPSEHIRDFLSDAFELGNVSIEYLTQARLAFEPTVAGLAAENATEEDLRKMREFVEESERQYRDNGTEIFRPGQFYRLIAQATKNPVLSVIVDSLSTVLARAIENRNLPAEVVKHNIAVHKEIVEAITVRDSQRAYQLMLDHSQDVQRRWDKTVLRQDGSGATVGVQKRYSP